MKATLSLLVGGAALMVAAGPAASQNGAPSGEQLFKQRCQICHAVDVGKPSPIGPHLGGVVGRKAASTAYAYSVALRKSGLVWTPANLSTFLAGPAKLVPGTRMSVVLSDPAQRTAIVQYLATKK